MERTEFRREALHQCIAFKKTVPRQIVKDGQHPGGRRRGTTPVFRVQRELGQVKVDPVVKTVF